MIRRSLSRKTTSHERIQKFGEHFIDTRKGSYGLYPGDLIWVHTNIRCTLPCGYYFVIGTDANPDSGRYERTNLAMVSLEITHEQETGNEEDEEIIEVCMSGEEPMIWWLLADEYYHIFKTKSAEYIGVICIELVRRYGYKYFDSMEQSLQEDIITGV